MEIRIGHVSKCYQALDTWQKAELHETTACMLFCIALVIVADFISTGTLPLLKQKIAQRRVMDIYCVLYLMLWWYCHRIIGMRAWTYVSKRSSSDFKSRTEHATGELGREYLTTRASKIADFIHHNIVPNGWRLERG